jgi:hypothetical protein
MTIIRSKWMLLKTDSNILRISDKIRNSSFNNENGFGFEMFSQKDDFISAKYTEQFQYRESYIDPYGEENIVESTRFKHVEFDLKKLFSGVYLLRLVNSPKSSTQFFLNLKKIFNTFLSVSDISIDIEKFMSELGESERLKQFRIKQIVVSGITLNRHSRSKIEVTSTLNALEDFKEYYPSNKYVLDKIKCSFRIAGADIAMEIRKTGTIAHSKFISDLLSRQVARSLYNESNSEVVCHL